MSELRTMRRWTCSHTEASYSPSITPLIEMSLTRYCFDGWGRLTGTTDFQTDAYLPERHRWRTTNAYLNLARVVSQTNHVVLFPRILPELHPAICSLANLLDGG